MEGTEAVCALVLKGKMAVSAILLFALLQAAIMDNALVPISARVILHTVVAPAMVSAILLHAAITDHALVPISARAILDTLIISAMPSTVRYAIMEESVIMLERIRIVIHVAMVVKARFAIFL